MSPEEEEDPVGRNVGDARQRWTKGTRTESEGPETGPTIQPAESEGWDEIAEGAEEAGMDDREIRQAMAEKKPASESDAFHD